MNEAITVYKLIILYTLNRIGSPVTLDLVSNYIVEHEYTNYFNVQNAFAELLDAGLVACSRTYNISYYDITDAGQETLTLFYTNLSYEIRREIDDYLRENQYRIMDCISTASDYMRRDNGDYIALCSIKENNELLFEIKLAVPSEQDAIKLCNNWKAGSEKLYSDTIKTLLN